MDWKIERFEEETEFDPKRGYIRYKSAVFTVDGSEHTLRISMKDFDEGRAPQIVEKEAQKIITVLERTGSGTEGKK